MTHLRTVTALCVLATLGAASVAKIPGSAGQAGVAPGAAPIGWWRSLVGAVGGSPPLVVDGVVYATSPDGTATAFDAMTGEEHWRVPGTDSLRASPAFTGDSVIVAGDAGTVRALDPATGVERWVASLGHHIESAAAVAGASLYLGAGTSLVALDASTGLTRWSVDLGGSILTSPVVVGDRVVVASGLSVCALSLDTGTRLWCDDIDTAATATLAVDSGTAFVGGWDGSVVAVGIADGQVRWRAMTPGGGPAMVTTTDGVVFAADEDGGVVALDGPTGDMRWRIELGRRAVGPPVAVDGRLVVRLADGVVDMLDSTDGSMVWRYGSGPGISPATVSSGVVYAVTMGGGLVAVGDAADPRRPHTGGVDPDPAAGLAVAGGGPARAGRQPGPGPDAPPVVAWSHEFGSDLDSAPVMADGLVLVGNRESFLFAMDARTGDERWRFATTSWITQSATTAGDTVFVGDEGGAVFGLSATDGRQLWRVDIGGPVGEAMVAAGDTVFAPVRDGPLLALDAATGAERWRVDDGSSPAIANGIAFLRAGDSLTAVDALTGAQRWTVKLGFLGAPTVAGGLVYIRSSARTARVFDALTGAEQPVTISGSDGLAVGDGVGVMAAPDALLDGIDISTGWTRWTFGTRGTEVGNVPMVPVIAGDTAYAGTTDRSGVLEAVDVASGTERWSYRAGVNLLLTQPLVVDGVVYVGAGSTLLALAAPGAVPLATREPAPMPTGGSPSSAPGASPAGSPAIESGVMLGGGPGRSGIQPGPAPRTEPAERWRTAAGSELRGGTIVVDGLVYVVDNAGMVSAIDAATGTLTWQVDMGAAPAGPTAPVVADGVVYAVDGTLLHALNAATGVEGWNLALGSRGSSAMIGTDLMVSGPSSIAAVNVAGGRGFIRWTFTEAALADVGTGLLDVAVSGGSLFMVEPASQFVDGSGALVALDAATGTEQWRVTDVDGERVSVPPAAIDGVVYAGGTDGSLWAFDAGTGDVRWTADARAEVTSAPAVADGLVIVGNDDGDLVAVDATTGDGRWVFTTDDVVAAAPSVAGDVVIVSSYDGHTYALDAASGSELWDVRTGRETDGAPSVVDGWVFVTAGQDVIAYGP